MGGIIAEGSGVERSARGMWWTAGRRPVWVRLCQIPAIGLILGAAAAAILLAAGTAPTAAQGVGSPTSPQVRVGPANADSARRQADRLKEIGDRIGKLSSAADEGLVPEFRMQSTIDALEDSRRELRDMVEDLTPRLADALKRLEQLGPAPQPAEAEVPEVAAHRKGLGEQVAAFDGLIKRAELLFVQAGQTLTRLAELRRSQFRRQLLRRAEEVGSLSFWQRALANLPQHVRFAAGAFGEWTGAKLSFYPIAVLAALVAAVLLGSGVRRLMRMLLAEDRAPPDTQRQGRAERGARILRNAVSAASPFVAAIGAFLGIAIALDVLAEDEARLLVQIVVYLAVSAFLLAALSAALVPERVDDMLVDVDPVTGRRLRSVLAWLVIVWLGDQLVTLLDTQLSSPLELVTLHLITASVLYAGLLCTLVLVPLVRDGAPVGDRRTNGWPPYLFGAVAAAPALILGAVALGYVQLASFMASQLVATGGLVLLVTLIHLTAEFVSIRRPEATSGEPAAGTATVDAKVMNAALGVTLGLGLDLIVLLLGVPLLLLQWGYDWSTVRGWIQSAFFGFQIGAVRISLETLFVSILILLLGILATRLVRRLLLYRIRMVVVRDSGAVDSIGAILTYTGFLVSLLVALSYLGVSLSNLAIVAGALSVGIGFGLQSIANNFVSGLILLAERPIKVGDWIVLGDQQGRVQKISVRSTEIRTFDRSTVIVPNADLITGRVVNWTHGDTLGRIVIPIGVSYDSDPRQVIEILLKIGRECPRTLDHPKTIVVFEGFGDSSLDFTLRTYIRDISDMLEVKTELRLAIFEALGANGIEIPFPQRDVHVRSGDRQAIEPPFKRKAARE